MSKELEKLRKKAEALFEQEKFSEIIELLGDEVLEKQKDAQLYAWLARAHYRLNDDADKFLVLAQKAIDADPNYFMGYLARGYAWYLKGDNKKSITDYNRAILLNPNYAATYYNRGNTWSKLNYYEKATADYNKAIELRPDYSFTYNNRGSVWSKKGEFKKAIYDYNCSIELKPDNAEAYYNRGNTWYRLNDYDKSIADYNKAIELKPNYHQPFYNRGLSRKENGKDFEASIKDFEKYLELTPEKNDIWAIRARDFIDELREKIKDGGLKEIGGLTTKIRKLLLISESCITHYTGLSITKKLILDPENKFRISEGSFLNDTSEGTELFKFLGYQFSERSDGLMAETFAPKPFIGSFVAEDKHDDLNLWRFYGKENGVEAKGCALTLRMKEFIDAINLAINKGNEKEGTSIGDDISFYQVAYWDHDSSKINFHIPNSSKKDEKTLNTLMIELKEKVTKYRAKDKSILEKYLNSIAYLFKSDVYKNENELRLVIKGIEFEKKFDLESNPPRVYIELINIRHLVEQITLGPKVDKPDEWAAALYYSYDRETDEKKKPKKILVSRLPYK